MKFWSWLCSLFRSFFGAAGKMGAPDADVRPWERTRSLTPEEREADLDQRAIEIAQRASETGADVDPAVAARAERALKKRREQEAAQDRKGATRG
jgi:hypothetical protein